MGSLGFIMISLIIAWLVLTVKQFRGDFVASAIHVQFEDEFWAPLASFSGLYKREPGSFWEAGRGAVYREIRTVSGAEYPAQFSYCRSLQAWVFQIGVEPNSARRLNNL